MIQYALVDVTGQVDATSLFVVVSTIMYLLICQQRLFHRCGLTWRMYGWVPVPCYTYTYTCIKSAMVFVRIHVRIHVLYRIIRIRTVTVWIRIFYLYWMYDRVWWRINVTEKYEFGRLPSEFVFLVYNVFMYAYMVYLLFAYVEMITNIFHSLSTYV